MSIVAALKVKTFLGCNIDKLIIAGDSRVIRPSHKTGKFESQCDSAQKVIPVFPNIIIGFAGDYRIVNVINQIKRDLEKSELGKQKHTTFAYFLRPYIKKFLIENFKSNWGSTSVFLVIQDFVEKVKRVHKLELPEKTFVELDEGLHLSSLSRLNLHSN